VGRIFKGETRPSQVTADRIADAFEVPPEFNVLMVKQASERGRKMRFDDGHEFTPPVGHYACPVWRQRCLALMQVAIAADPDTEHMAHEFERQHAVYSVGRYARHDTIVSGLSVDPWGEFKRGPGVLYVAWQAEYGPLGAMTGGVDEFNIAHLAPEGVIRCTCHE
jgi:hypothetical protein